MTIWILGVAAGLTIAGVAAQAHHSIAGVYDSGREATVDGVVTQFQFVSPHPFVNVRDGRTNQPWQLEMDNRRELEAIGFAIDTLKPGDRVVVVGSLARRDANRMYIRRLDRPADGFSYEQVGNSPRLRPRPR
ncbi:MAG: putative signal peptide protein [Acidobacteria bacterium]|nr:putative signal peptide protein [Acidobacteriota bacterium]